MSRQVLLSTRPGVCHPEAPITQALVESVLDLFETRKSEGDPSSLARVLSDLDEALADGREDDRFSIARAIFKGTGDIVLDGTTGAARLKG